MNDDYILLSDTQVAAATLLILINAGLSAALGLGLGRRLLTAAVRMTVQLLLVGLVLRWVFALDRWWAVAGVLSLMTLTAGISAVRRTDRRFAGVWTAGIVSVWSSAWIVGALALLVIVRVEPWWRPQYAIPLVGMILGNTLTGISLGLDRFVGEVETRRDEVETLLALGATRWEAAAGPLREAVRTGMIPILNAMLVAGIVSLPGMMTGQLIAGADPLQAVRYQIVIMFLIASGSALGTVVAVLLSYRRLFDSRHRVRLEGK